MMTRRMLIGMYEDVKEAEQMVDDLLRSGFRWDQIKLVTSENAQDIRRSFIPVEHQYLYEQGLVHGATMVMVEVMDENAEKAINIINRHNPIDLNRRKDQWVQSKKEEYKAEVGQERAESEGEKMVFPEIQEELVVGKRRIETGKVRIHTWIEEEEVEETVNLREERIEVERHDADRPATKEDFEALKDSDYEINLKGEEPVVDKEARVVGEVEVEKETRERSETIQDTLRHTEVDVGDLDERVTISDEFTDSDDFFRDHFITTYSGTNARYDDFLPYYEYGYYLVEEERQDRSWNEIEREARREFELNFPGESWDEARPAVRAGWQARKNNM